MNQINIVVNGTKLTCPACYEGECPVMGLLIAIMSQLSRVQDPYPQSVEEVLDDHMKFKKGAVEVLQRFKNKHVRDNSERFEAMVSLAAELSTIYEIATPSLKAEDCTPSGFSGASSYAPETHEITMRGKLSIITFLHEFGHALGKNEWDATKWSVNLFRKVYPDEFEKLEANGHVLVRPEGEENGG